MRCTPAPSDASTNPTFSPTLLETTIRYALYTHRLEVEPAELLRSVAASAGGERWPGLGALRGDARRQRPGTGLGARSPVCRQPLVRRGGRLERRRWEGLLRGQPVLPEAGLVAQGGGADLLHSQPRTGEPSATLEASRRGIRHDASISLASSWRTLPGHGKRSDATACSSELAYDTKLRTRDSARHDATSEHYAAQLQATHTTHATPRHSDALRSISFGSHQRASGARVATGHRSRR